MQGSVDNAPQYLGALFMERDFKKNLLVAERKFAKHAGPFSQHVGRFS